MASNNEAPPPRPPPHGQNPRPPGGLPDGNYDIFIIPPHSAGSGFLYLPSMQPQRNSFLAGVACTLFAVGIYTLAVPVLRHWISLVMGGGGGLGVVILVIAVGVGAWAWGRTQAENNGGPGFGGGGAGASASGSSKQQSSGPPPRYSAPPPPQSEQPKTNANGSAGAWEKAREETRKREEERKRAEELKRKREEAQKAREEADRAAKAEAEKKKWEQARAREKEQREREARERIARERQERERGDAEKARSAPSARNSPTKNYEKPSAKSEGRSDEFSYRPYDKPKATTYKSSASSVSGLSESSYAPSQSTARTTPPPSHRGPYSTKDPDKIQIKAVYLFSDSFPTKPISQLVAKQGLVTDGLILRIKTEGLFIDDDVRGVPQREWDVKAWTLKLVEDGMTKGVVGGGLHVFRATTRDTENKKYTFILDESEAWKVAIGLARLRKGSQVRSLGMNGMKENEIKGLLTSLGWM